MLCDEIRKRGPLYEWKRVGKNGRDVQYNIKFLLSRVASCMASTNTIHTRTICSVVLPMICACPSSIRQQKKYAHTHIHRLFGYDWNKVQPYSIYNVMYCTTTQRWYENCEWERVRDRESSKSTNSFRFECVCEGFGNHTSLLLNFWGRPWKLVFVLRYVVFLRENICLCGGAGDVWINVMYFAPFGFWRWFFICCSTRYMYSFKWRPSEAVCVIMDQRNLNTYGTF